MLVIRLKMINNKKLKAKQKNTLSVRKEQEREKDYLVSYQQALL